MRFCLRVKLLLSLWKPLQVVTCSTRSEISFRGDFTSALKTGAKFHPETNSLRFQQLTATNFQPGLILWEMLCIMQKILSHYHYLTLSLWLNNWNNFEVPSFRIFFFNFTLKSLNKVYFKKKQKLKKKKHKKKNSDEKMRH